MNARPIFVLLALLVVGGCDGETDGPEQAVAESSDLTQRGVGTPAERVDAFRALTPISQPTNGILPKGESERRWAQSGGHFTQGLWAGTNDDGRACTVHVIHYDWRDGGKSEWLQVWNDDEATIRRYDEDFDPNVSGVEVRIARTDSGPHTLSLTDDPDPGDDVRAFASSAGALKITVNALVKNAREEQHDIETEIHAFDRPGSGVTVRIKKFLADDVVRCHDLKAKKGPTD